MDAALPRPELAERPSGPPWELLAAVGVRSLSKPHPLVSGGPWHARFAYSLEAHLQAARLGGFTRTLNCNEFFLSQGSAGARLQAGLSKAGRDRLTAAHATAYDDALAVAGAASDTLMRARDARSSHDYGDLVPLGILLTGLRRLMDGPGALVKRGLNAVAHIRRRLRDGQTDGGWAVPDRRGHDRDRFGPRALGPARLRCGGRARAFP